MNVVSIDKDDGRSVEHKLNVWKLISREWQLVTEICAAFIETDFDFFPLSINSFDGNTMYLRSEMQESFLSIDLQIGSVVLHSELERSRNGQQLSTT